MTKEELYGLKALSIDMDIKEAAKNYWDGISKPIDGLGDFEDILVKIFACLRDMDIKEFKKAIVIMCADNGIVKEGVSQCDQINTYLVAKLLGKGRSSASKMAQYTKAQCIPVDIGINCQDEIEGVRNCKISKGTRSFVEDKAMTEEQALEAIGVGIQMVMELKKKGYHLIATGEMGIGNTTTATALLCALTNMEVEAVTGRGAGLSDEGLRRKKEVISRGLSVHNLYAGNNDKEHALNALVCVGGLDIAAMVGIFIGGAVYGVPIIIDGLISSVAALVAKRIMGDCVNYMIPSHAGRERGTQIVLNELGLDALINGNMALGEGTGALLLFPLIDMVLDFYNNATTFMEGNIDQYSRELS